MKQQVVYIHGGESFLEYSVFFERLSTAQIWDLPNIERDTKWTKHFASDLGETYEVFMPKMPNPQNAKYREWQIWFERHFEYLHDGVILIGCSLGAMFLLRYVSENDLPFKVKALFIMAPVIPTEGFDDTDCGDFLCDVKMISNIQHKVSNLLILHSKDDFLVPYEHSLKLHTFLPKAKFISFEDKNHFLVADLPELIELIKKVE